MMQFQSRPIKNPLPPAVVEKVKPVFDKLGSKEFLAACENLHTQNLNKFYQHVVWSLVLKG